MATFTVLYDGACSFCRRCRDYLAAREALVPLCFLDMHSARARDLRAGRVAAAAELVVIADDGRFWAGPDAFIVCLWATGEWRGWAATLSAPLFRPFAQIFFSLVSSNRGVLSHLSMLFGGERCDGHCGATVHSAYR